MSEEVRTINAIDPLKDCKVGTGREDGEATCPVVIPVTIWLYTTIARQRPTGIGRLASARAVATSVACVLPSLQTLECFTP